MGWPAFAYRARKLGNRPYWRMPVWAYVCEQRHWQNHPDDLFAQLQASLDLTTTIRKRHVRFRISNLRCSLFRLNIGSTYVCKFHLVFPGQAECEWRFSWGLRESFGLQLWVPDAVLEQLLLTVVSLHKHNCSKRRIKYPYRQTMVTTTYKTYPSVRGT